MFGKSLPYNRRQRAQMGVDVQINSSSTSALGGGGISAPLPGRITPGNTRYPLYRRLGGHQGRSGRVQNISPPPGFDPRTVQPVASPYTVFFSHFNRPLMTQNVNRLTVGGQAICSLI
jgi:hypothetical protein